MEGMKKFLTITVASYALLGNVALAGAPALPSALPGETNMTLAPSSDLAQMSSAKSEAGSCRSVQEKQAGHSVALSDGACPTDRCVAEAEDQGETEHVAFLMKGQEVTTSVALVPLEKAPEILSLASDHSSHGGGRSLVATVISSVIFRE